MANLENYLVFFLKIQLNIHTPHEQQYHIWVFIQERTYKHKNTWTYILIHFLYNSQKLDTTRMSINWQRNKLGIHAMEHYRTIKRIKLQTHIKTCMTGDWLTQWQSIWLLISGSWVWAPHWASYLRRKKKKKNMHES